MKKRVSFLLALVFLLTSIGFGSLVYAEPQRKVINVGINNATSALNPLSANGLLASHATGLMFPPLMELNGDLEFVSMLAESVTTQDNQHFTIKLYENAKWSDGEAITADDVIFTFKLLGNPEVGSIYSYMFSVIEGYDEYGYLPQDGSDIAGIKKVDDYTIEVTTKDTMHISVFNNGISRYVLTVPEHILKDVAPKDLVSSEFFQKPSVVSGPFKLLAYDRDHYIQFEANKDYFKGAPKIDQLNFIVAQGAEMTTRLESGEIDLNAPAIGNINNADYDRVQSLENVTIVKGDPIANEYVYINEDIVPDAKVRKALVYGINRQLIVDQLLQGHGEVVDGFLTSASPYFDKTLGITEHNPEEAKKLLAEAGWDPNKEITFLMAASDVAMTLASNIVVANLAEIGVKAKIEIVDFTTLSNRVAEGNYELAIMQYSLVPIDPYPDVSWLLGPGNVNKYNNEEVNKLLDQIKVSPDTDELLNLYSQIDKIAQDEVPMFSIFVNSFIGVVNNRVTGATPKEFGLFVNVHEWDVTQ